MPLFPFVRRQAGRLYHWIYAESQQIAAFLKRRIAWLLVIWAALALLGGMWRVKVLIAAMPQALEAKSLAAFMAPYLLIAAAPALGWFLASRAYPEHGAPQPEVRMSVFGRWRRLAPDQARRHGDYGVAGFLTSLSAGLLMSMLMRLGQYLMAVPAMPATAPQWGLTWFQLMTADLIVLSFMYFTCFTMALRAAPMFPRMLLLTWLYDIIMQNMIARQLAAADSVPAVVMGPLEQFLSGNVQKVLISMVIWLPYLIVSRRVNLTFRHRIRRSAKPTGA